MAKECPNRQKSLRRSRTLVVKRFKSMPPREKLAPEAFEEFKAEVVEHFIAKPFGNQGRGNLRSNRRPGSNRRGEIASIFLLQLLGKHFSSRDPLLLL